MSQLQTKAKADGLAADAIIKAMQDQREGVVPEPTPAPEPTPEPTPEPAPEPAPEPTPEPAPEPADPLASLGDDKWEARYKVLQGKYNAEVPELHRRVRGLEDALQKALLELDTVQRTQPKEPEPKKEPETNPSTGGTDWAKVFSEKELEDYPPEFFNVVDRLARFRAEQMVKAEVEPLKQTAEQLTRHTAETAQETFNRELLGLIPDLNTLNVDPNFLAYLNNTDPRSGHTLHQLLLSAYQQRDAARVKIFFDDYRRLITPAAKVAPAPVPAQSMTDQVSPGRNRAAGQPTPDDGVKVYTVDEVAKFYADKRAGKYKGREAEANRIEQEIFRQQPKR